MQEKIKGHTYELENLKSSGFSELKFFMDPRLHNGRHQEGPSTQEVIRACIAKVNSLNEEKSHSVNSEIVLHLRKAIALFEIRALELSVAKGMEIEKIPTNSKGHIWTDEK